MDTCETIALVSLEDTRSLATALAQHAKPGDVLTLSGEVGTGKTAFARFFIQALSAAPVEVTSPTFNLLQTYAIGLKDGVETELWHYDLYRIENAAALTELGIEDALKHIVLIEWPDRLAGMRLPVAAALEFCLASDGARKVRVTRDCGIS